MTHSASPAGLFVLLLLMWPATAMAYIDPGSGVVLLQALVAAAIGVAYRLRRVFAAAWRSLIARFRR